MEYTTGIKTILAAYDAFETDLYLDPAVPQEIKDKALKALMNLNDLQALLDQRGTIG